MFIADIWKRHGKIRLILSPADTSEIHQALENITNDDERKKSTVQDSQGEKKEKRCFINSCSKTSHFNCISNIYIFARNEPEKIKGFTLQIRS